MKLSLLHLHVLRSGTGGLVALGLLSTVARADSADAGSAAGTSPKRSASLRGTDSVAKSAAHR
jgi:hypothetical protein